MNPIKLNGRAITGVQVMGVDSKDAPEFCNAYIESAVWADTGVHLTNEELDELNESGPDLSEHANEMLVDRAETLHDLLTER